MDDDEWIVVRRRGKPKQPKSNYEGMLDLLTEVEAANRRAANTFGTFEELEEEKETKDPALAVRAQ